MVWRAPLLAITYLIYILLWEGVVLGGCGYIVFGLGYSGWWFLLALYMSGSAYSPEKWGRLFSGSYPTTKG